jgi:hypothetical protein
VSSPSARTEKVCGPSPTSTECGGAHGENAAGPRRHSNLPGAIVEVKTNDADRIAVMGAGPSVIVVSAAGGRASGAAGAGGSPPHAAVIAITPGTRRRIDERIATTEPGWARILAVVKGMVSVLLFAAATGVAAWQLGDGYAARMSYPKGYALVTVDDPTGAPPKSRPRRAVVVVADGLRYDAALGMAATKRLAAAGQCRPMDVGAPSLSRPVYTALSTGVEQDRSGVRNNDDDRAAAARSIWEVARKAGLRVEARSELDWWRETFPAAFDATVVRPREEDYFAPPLTADLTLIHPVYIDEIGHDHGGLSAEYAAAVARLDVELGALLAKVDLARDLVVLLSDHGHSARGGHGGRTPEVSTVLACFAGHGVALRSGQLPGMLAIDVAPALAVLLGLPYPPNMRAGADNLDVILRIADPRVLGSRYLIDRDIALTRFRTSNPDWPAVYDEGRSAHAWKLGALLAMIVMGVGLTGGWRAGVWLVVTVAAAVIFHVAWFGSFDVTAINQRSPYVRAASAQWITIWLLAFAARWAWARDLDVAVRDLIVATAAGLLVCVALVWIFGWPLGFPAPTPRFFFLPYFAAIGTMWLAATLGGAALARLIFRR